MTLLRVRLRYQKMHLKDFLKKLPNLIFKINGGPLSKLFAKND